MGNKNGRTQEAGEMMRDGGAVGRRKEGGGDERDGGVGNQLKHETQSCKKCVPEQHSTRSTP